jgi:ribonuclease BN (tRNA processing enzyme)
VAELTVRFLGAGDAVGSGGRFQTCISLRSPATHALLDCGASSLVAMKQQGVDPASVDAVLVTHLHGDQFGGIPFHVLDARFARRTRPLLLVGPPGFRERVHQAMEMLFPGGGLSERPRPNHFPLRRVMTA